MSTYKIKVKETGTIFYCKNGKPIKILRYKNKLFHHDTLPAIENFEAFSNETEPSKFWFQNGQLHRIDGPAIEHPNGMKAWYKFGRLHRNNGPAFIPATANIALYLSLLALLISKTKLDINEEYYLHGEKQRKFK
jgi:hypothetical protein